MVKRSQTKRTGAEALDRPQRRQAPERAKKPKPLHPAQWIVGLSSALLTAALIGFVFHRALAVGAGVPDLAVRVDRVEPLASGAGKRLAFTVLNRGEATAAAVVVQAEIGTGDARRSIDVTLDYVPALSEATGAFILAEDPARVPVRLSVGGYSDP